MPQFDVKTKMTLIIEAENSQEAYQAANKIMFHQLGHLDVKDFRIISAEQVVDEVNITPTNK